VFLSTAPGGNVHSNFSRFPAAHKMQTGHHTVQIGGAIVSEQLEGVTALAHSRMAGAGGPGRRRGAVGRVMPAGWSRLCGRWDSSPPVFAA
jgi:hypothetical protein